VQRRVAFGLAYRVCIALSLLSKCVVAAKQIVSFGVRQFPSFRGIFSREESCFICTGGNSLALTRGTA
jgi:hypothetical protein